MVMLGNLLMTCMILLFSLSLDLHFPSIYIFNNADEKLYSLCNNEVTRNLKAVQNRRFITIPFSATTLGVRIGSLAFNLAEAVTALVENGSLSPVQFTEVTLADQDAKEALGKSGAIVYTRLPIVESVDLETFCPGGQSNIFIADDTDQEPAVIVEEPVDVDVEIEEPAMDMEEEEEDAMDSSTVGETAEVSAASQLSIPSMIGGMIAWAFFGVF